MIRFQLALGACSCRSAFFRLGETGGLIRIQKWLRLISRILENALDHAIVHNCCGLHIERFKLLGLFLQLFCLGHNKLFQILFFSQLCPLLLGHNELLQIMDVHLLTDNQGVGQGPEILSQLLTRIRRPETSIKLLPPEFIRSLSRHDHRRIHHIRRHPRLRPQQLTRTKKYISVAQGLCCRFRIPLTL